MGVGNWKTPPTTSSPTTHFPAYNEFPRPRTAEKQLDVRCFEPVRHCIALLFITKYPKL
jgi:hypothetical protein